MDDLDTVVSRIEHVDLPAGTRELHLKRITRALHHNQATAAPAGRPAAEIPTGRRRTTPVTVLAGAAVAAIVTGVWFLFTPTQPATTTAPSASPASSPTATAETKPGPEPSPLTDPGAAAELAGLLHITPTAAKAGLTRLAALADQTGGRLDPANAQFGAVATDLGVTAAALDTALTRLKASAAADYPASGAKPAGSPDRTGPDTTPSGPAGSNILTTEATTTELAGLLHITSTAAKAGLTRLAALADQTGGRLDPKTAQFRDIAADLGTTPTDLDSALAHIKAGAADADPASTAKAKAAAALAGKGATNRAPESVPADRDVLTDPTTATQLSATLHVTPAAARTALTRLATLSEQQKGLNPSSAAFRDVATNLGTTPATLTQVLRQIKTGG